MAGIFDARAQRIHLCIVHYLNYTIYIRRNPVFFASFWPFLIIFSQLFTFLSLLPTDGRCVFIQTCVNSTFSRCVGRGFAHQTGDAIGIGACRRAGACSRRVRISTGRRRRRPLRILSKWGRFTNRPRADVGIRPYGLDRSPLYPPGAYRHHPPLGKGTCRLRILSKPAAMT